MPRRSHGTGGADAPATPGPDPTLDAGQLRLLDRLRLHIPPHVRLRTEVPLPIDGDQRAWDGLMLGLHGGATLPVEADTRLLDVQAQSRRIALKCRDAGVDAVMWVIRASTPNRQAVALAAPALTVDFPVSARAALAALAAGRHPGGSAVILL